MKALTIVDEMPDTCDECIFCEICDFYDEDSLLQDPPIGCPLVVDAEYFDKK